MNRVGDAGFLLGMFTIAWYFGLAALHRRHRSCAQRPVRRLAILIITAATLLLFVGASGKSAQIPLYVWLPDAMEGPTPVSALIHAATMVTAGVYMVARSNALFMLAPDIDDDRGHRRRVHRDLRRHHRPGAERHQARAGLLHGQPARLHVPGAGRRRVCAGVFHVFTHAFFKALLFLGSGSVIHAMSGEQDMRNMGGLKGKNSDHVLDHGDRDSGHRGHSAVGGVLLQGRDSLAGLVVAKAAPTACSGSSAMPLR